MQKSSEEKTVLEANSTNSQDTSTIVQTDVGAKNGQTKCPKCGATDISLNVNNGHLKCNFCKYEFEPEKIIGMQEDISMLNGQVMASGTKDIATDAKDVVTLKCSSCGAEVVIDTKNSVQARCHWCRNILSINEQIPNGSVPDVVLPFQVKKEDAKKLIEDFVGKRKFYAHPKFKQEFQTDNIMGVYFPYMVVDVNSHACFSGQAEHEIRSYTVGDDESSRTLYDADLYNIEREFDLTINGLTVESNSDRLDKSQKTKTNNIINSIMPFDIENCVKYDSNYLSGYTSEKRDTNIEQLKELVDLQSKDIAKFSANESLKQYDRGVCFTKEDFIIKGEQWKAAYLPVWLYSYQEVKGNNKLLHYVAVNARTKETMGSVPIHIPKLLLISFLIEIIGIVIMTSFNNNTYSRLFLLTGIIYYIIIYLKYRNTNARHKYETETTKQVANLRKVDNYVTRRNGLSNSKIEGVNNTKLSGENLRNKIVKSLNK